MFTKSGVPWDALISWLRTMLLEHSEIVEVGEWQAIRDSNHPMATTYELQNVSFEIAMPWDMESAQTMIQPNLPWAEDHFQERVSGEPLNPPPSEAWWPFAVKNNEAHKEGKKFSHTYPERFWPRFAGARKFKLPPGHGNTTFVFDDLDEGFRYAQEHGTPVPRRGIRYEYGDLADIVDMLVTSPGSRQAYLPVWFPEDTGARENQRVPCSLGYHFMIRKQRVYCNYYIRSCDYFRHFRDDVYMAIRLTQWLSERLNQRWAEEGAVHRVQPATLSMHIASFHIFKPEHSRLRMEKRDEVRGAT